MNIIEEFGNLSGLKLNKNKTEGIWLGRLKHTKDKYENITWTNEPIKSLGVYFGYNKTQCDQLNYEKQINKCKAIIKNWNQRNISLIGRITVFKSLILPNITFIGSCTIIPLSLDNYRPITLLNTDTKILAYTIAQRLKEVLPSIIHSDQKGYVKNRYIGFNIRQIQDAIDHSEKFNIEGAILFLDFTKAFDSLEWSFMTECLEKFGFKSSFIRWIRTMYTDIKGCILNNGWVSAPFKVFRGIRQGCPASALIFVLAVEIMAIKLRETKHIRGIEIKVNSITGNLKI
jgi:hypothetical protein